MATASTAFSRGVIVACGLSDPSLTEQRLGTV